MTVSGNLLKLPILLFISQKPLGGLMDIAFPFLIPTQDVVEGPGSSARVAEILKRNGGTKALVITDKTLHELGILDTMLKGMEEAGYPCAIYDGVEPNPSIENIEAAFAMYQSEGCDCLVGFGGGSSMDACKGVSLRVAKPDQTIKEMGRLMGYFPISFSLANSRVPYIVAVPTTAGTGAESTVAAVISDHAIDKKYTVTDIARSSWMPPLPPVFRPVSPLLLLSTPFPTVSKVSSPTAATRAAMSGPSRASVSSRTTSKRS